MIRRWAALFLVMVGALCAPTLLMAQSLPADDGAAQIPYLVELIGRGFHERNWLLVAGAALMIFTVLLRGLLKVAQDRPGLKPILPWLTVGMGLAAAVGAALIAGQSLAAAIVGALTAGAAGVGLWELLGKKVWAMFSKGKREEGDVKKAALAAYKAGSLQLDSSGRISLSKPPVN